MYGFLFALVGLYALERLLLLRPGQIAWILGSGPLRARRLDDESGWANRFGTLHLLSLVPEQRTLVIAEEWPCACSAEGLTDGRQGFLTWDQVSEIRTEDKAIFVDGRRAFRRATVASAQHLAAFLESLRVADEVHRDEMIADEVSRRADSTAAQGRTLAAEESTRDLRRIAGAFAVVWALFLPVLLLVTGIGWFFLATLLLALILWLAAVGMVWRRLPGSLTERLEAVASLAFLAPATVRAAEIITRGEDFCADPIAVGLLPDALDLDWIRLRYARLRHPLEDEMPESVGGHATFESFRALQIAAFEAGLRQAEISPESLRVPSGSGTHARSFCPRCHATFTQPEAVCRRCHDRPTEAF